jgi:uncharacterized protein (TIGR02300 family)
VARHRAAFGAKINVLKTIDSGAARGQVKRRFQTYQDFAVAKPDLGTKRLCASCGAKFYDLSKDPIVCPKCETVFHPVVYTSRSRGGAQAAAAVAPLVPEVAEAPEAAEVELVSLEEADAESEGGKKAAGDDVDVGDDEVEVADDGAEDDTFLEADEDEGDDVSDIVGGGGEDDEDT